MEEVAFFFSLSLTGNDCIWDGIPAFWDMAFTGGMEKSRIMAGQIGMGMGMGICLCMCLRIPGILSTLNAQGFFRPQRTVRLQ